MLRRVIISPEQECGMTGMTIDELRAKLESLISGLPVSDFGAVKDSAITKLSDYAAAASALGMSEGKKLIENLIAVFKARKQGNSTDTSVSIRLTAIDFYVKKLQSGSTEDL
jgi:hypothetical protein